MNSSTKNYLTRKNNMINLSEKNNSFADLIDLNLQNRHSPKKSYCSVIQSIHLFVSEQRNR